MLRANRLFLLLGALAVALLLWLSYVLYSTKPFQTCLGEREKGYKAAQEAKENPAKGSFTLVRDARNDTVCAFHVLYEYRDAVTALATLFIALFTLTLWWATRGLLRISSGGLIDLERPYLFVDFSRPVFAEGTIAVPNDLGGYTYTIPKSIISVRYSLYNSGRTAAILTQIRHNVVQTGSDETLPPETDPSVGESDDEIFADGTAIEKTRQFAIDFDNRTAPPGLNGVFLIGFVRYRDIFRKRHITGFCARLDRRTNRFILEGDRRYNYTDPHARVA